MTVLAALCAVGVVTSWRQGRRPRSRLPGMAAGAPQNARAAAGGAVAIAMRRRFRRPSQPRAADLALCLDLLGGSLACGCMPAAAALAAASAAPVAAAQALRTAATELSLGEDPAVVWSAVGAAVPGLAGAARACARAAVTGAAVADELHRQASAARSASHADRRSRLQRAAVWLVLPLGVCFLPAFVLVGVVPVVVGAVPNVLP